MALEPIAALHGDPAYETALAMLGKTLPRKVDWLWDPSLSRNSVTPKQGTDGWWWIAPFLRRLAVFSLGIICRLPKCIPEVATGGAKGGSKLAPTWLTRPRPGVDCICPEGRRGLHSLLRGAGMDSAASLHLSALMLTLPWSTGHRGRWALGGNQG